MSTRLADELVGDAAVRQLRREELVYGGEVVAQKIEPADMGTLKVALRRAVAATNQAHRRDRSAITRKAESREAAVPQLPHEDLRALARLRAATHAMLERAPSRWFG